VPGSLAEQLFLFPDGLVEYVLQGLPGAETGEHMFETPKEIKPSASKGLWVGIAVVVVVIGLGAYFFVTSKGAKRTPSASTAAQAKVDADPVRDLKVQRTTMEKGRSGTTAVWLVTIENKSTSYSYSNIQYETTYVGADNNAILINKGTIATTIAPGEQKNSEISDALYPAGTAWYKLRITGATASAQ
jgi:hypothetical protein